MPPSGQQPLPLRKRLSFRQARIAVVVAFLLGVCLSLAQLAFDLRSEQARIDRDVSVLLDTLSASATQAAYTLDRRLAERVLDGLFQVAAIQQARIVDDFGDALATRARAPAGGGLGWLANLTFAGIRDYHRLLQFEEGGEAVGELRVSVDTSVAARAFFERAALVLLGGIIRNLLLAAVLVWVFYQTLTRPLLAAARALGALDTDGGGASSDVRLPAGHEEDELGRLVGRMNELLRGREQTEQALRDSEERLRAVFDVFPGRMFLKDPDGRHLLVNDVFAAHLGLPKEAISGRTAQDLFAAPNADAYRAQDMDVLRTGAPSYEEYDETSGGVRRVLYTVKFPIRDADERIVAIGGLSLDITERKRMEEALRESEARFRSIAEATTHPLFIARRVDGRILYANEALRDAIGFPDDPRDHYSTELYWEPAERAELLDELSRSGVRRNHELRHRRADGRMFWAMTSSQALEFEGEDAMLTSFIDVTDRREAEAQRSELEGELRQAQKMQAIGQLTGGIAHDFNNILTSVLGFVGLAQRLPAASQPPMDRYLANIQQGGERARDLVQQLLTFSRSRHGESGPVDAATVITETLELLRPTLPPGIEIHTSFEEGAGLAKVDSVQLGQVVLNLCINARDAMGGSGGLEVEVRKLGWHAGQCSSCHERFGGEYVAICVRDSGEGMSPAASERIFEPFYSTKEAGGGTGMGLAIVHGIVHQHGGHVLLESAPGRGAVFTVLLLPGGEVVSVDRPRTLQVVPAGPDAGHVLVVDDEASVAAFLKELLESEGFRVTTASDGREALQRVEADPHAIDLVLTDQVMRHLSGTELARSVGGLRPDLPVILCTAYSDDLDGTAEHHASVRAVLRKPLEVHSLLAQVRALIGPRSPARQPRDQTR